MEIQNIYKGCWMKGISTVIATILMLMITIALAGTAYLYISGAFTTQTQGLELVDAFCSGRTASTISLRNVGTNAVVFAPAACGASAVANGATVACGSINVVRTSGQAGSTVWLSGDKATIDPGTIATLTDNDNAATAAVSEGCTVVGTARTCVYRITPPSGRSVVVTVSCPG